MMCEWYQHYLDLLRAYPRSDDTWFTQALMLCREGDVAARNRIAGASLWIVLDLAREFEPHPKLPLADLVEDGNTAVLEALETFQGDSCETYKLHLEQIVQRVLDRCKG